MELVKQAAERYGFNLEFKTKKILEENKYQVDLNVPLTGGTEVDVKASKYQTVQILIECKGTDPTSCLVLIKEAKGEYYNTRRHIIAHTNFAISQYKPDPKAEFYTFTGDFFKKTNKTELTKTAINDDNNNFYKAQIQIMEALNAIARRMASKNRLKQLMNNQNGGDLDIREHEELVYLVPIIVTNASIWVVDYTQDEIIVEPHRWVLQKARINEQILLENKNGDTPYSISVAIVSINYLDQFLGCVDNSSLTH
jgi:hypothetical protein